MSVLDVARITFNVTLSNLAADVEALDQNLPDWLTGVEGELPVLYALADVREARQQLAQIESSLERAAAVRMTGKPIAVTDPPLYAKRRYGKDRKEWKWDDLLRELVSPVAVDSATGEVLPGAFEASAVIRDCIGFAYGRVGAIKKRGVDPDEFCTAVPGRVTVTVSRTIPEADDA